MMDILEKDNQLNEKLKSIGLTLETLSISAAREHKIRQWLLISIAIDIIITVGLGALTFKTLNNSRQLAKTNQAAIMRDCETSNTTNVNQLTLWNHLLIPPATPRTDAQIKAAADFSTFVNKVFAVRQC